MSWSVAVPAALGAAGCMALASALQHRSTRDTSSAQLLRPTELAGFARTLLAQRLWWIALPIQVAGLTLHATALHNGALAAVQPLLIAGIVFALPLNRLLLREPITRREIGWTVLLVASLAVFLVVSNASTASSPASPSLRSIVAAMTAIVLIAGCLLGSRGGGPATAAGLLGVAAGVAYAMQALFLQDTATTLTDEGWRGLLTSGGCYGLLAAGGAGFVLSQLAYRAGPLAASLPAITVIGPLGGVLLGIVVNHEQLRTSVVAIVAEMLALAVLVAAGFALARQPAPRPPARTRR